MTRIERNRVWIYGKHAAFTALSNPNREVYEIRCIPTLKDKVRIARPGTHVMIADESVLSKIVNKNHQGIIICCKPLPRISKITSEDLAPMSRIMILDKMHDTHNIGSIMRSMAALNFDALITNNRDNFESEACKTSSGAIETIKLFQVSNVINAIKQLKENDFWIIGLDQDGKDFPIHHIPKLALVIGAEDQGIRRLLYQQCDKILSIGSNTAFPLNASVAASIAMHIATMKP
jgi:23S rRNA (guanosine2251-2'-O)-methyltransferase